MDTSSNKVMKKLFIFIFFLPLLLLGQQKPFINSISPTHIEYGQTLTITGSNLATVDLVSFGGVSVSGSNITVSDNLIEAIVPAGATHGSILVKTSSNLIAASHQQFFVSFSGSSPPSWNTEFIQPVLGSVPGLFGTDVYDICLCDLNNDNLNDVIITHNLTTGSSTEASIFENQSTFSTERFNQVLNINNSINSKGFISTTCADLDNDGDNDLIFTTNDGINPKHIFIYENTNPSGFTLTNNLSANLLLPRDSDNNNRVPRRIKTADIDGDGKLDLVVGNENDGTIHIFPNTSSAGNISFNTAIEVPIESAVSTGTIAIGNLDNDNKPDILIIPTSQSSQPIFVLKNVSIPGNINFLLQATVGVDNQRRNMVIGDFDNDGLQDFATTADKTINGVSGSEMIEIFRNTTINNEIIFTNDVNITIPINLPWGIDAGDLNGDGLLDIAVACIGGNIYTIENTTNGGTISFGIPVEQTTIANNDAGTPFSSTARNICIGDLDGDSRPDLAYTQNVLSSQPGNLGVRLNNSCFSPTITPDDLEFCFGQPFFVQATKIPPTITGATYTWEIMSPTTGTITTPNADNTMITINAGSSAAEVRVSLTLGSCTEQFSSSFRLIGGMPPAVPTFSSTREVICFQEDYTITVSGSFDEYEWTTPNGLLLTTTGSLAITDANFNHVGSYTVRGKRASSCFSSESVEFNLEVSQPPIFQIINNNEDAFCVGTRVSLEMPDFRMYYTYEWRKDGTPTGDGDVTEISTSQEGNYTVVLTDMASNCTIETAAYFIKEVNDPTSVISGPGETCVGFEITYTSMSTGDTGFDLIYKWEVDGDTIIISKDATSLNYTFDTPGIHLVSLTTSYDEQQISTCRSDIAVFGVAVSAPPLIRFNVAKEIRICPNEIVNISISSPSTFSIRSYEWAIIDIATSDTISTIPNDINMTSTVSINASIPQGSEAGVWVISRITTDIGCQIKDTVTLQNFANTLSILPEGTTTSMDTITLEQENFITLNASGGSDYRWKPVANLSSSEGTEVVFFPSQPHTSVILSGTDNNNCEGSDTLFVILDNLRPRKTFSPNGDGTNDCWEILNSSQDNTLGCRTFIFDARGRTIFVGDAPFADNCVWDGLFNGSPVVEGVYYFVLKCNNELMSKSGSILLAR